MNHFLAAAALILCMSVPAFAADVYGCIINETPAIRHGTISSDAQIFRFTVQGDYVWCRKIPEGQYSVKSDDGRLNTSFSASWQKSIGLVGDETLHWVVKIKEQDMK